MRAGLRYFLQHIVQAEFPATAPHRVVLEKDGKAAVHFLAQYRQMANPEVIKILHGVTSGSQVNGIDLLSASEAIGYGGLPGLSREVHRGFMKRYWGDEPEPYIHHFPDGNASIARLLVRSLIPDSASGNSMDDIVTASFDYGRLDQASAGVRLRLNSTVVRVEHEGSVASAKQVTVTYNFEPVTPFVPIGSLALNSQAELPIVN